jgi:hypothetical protein
MAAAALHAVAFPIRTPGAVRGPPAMHRGAEIQNLRFRCRQLHVIDFID